MLIDVHILDTTAGDRRVYLDDYEWEDEDSIRYLYGMGNYSCDCNRHLFYERVVGDPHWFGETECGEDRFVVEKIVERGTDRVIYMDAPFDEATIRSGFRTLPAPVTPLQEGSK